MSDLANSFRKAALLKNSERSMNEGERRGQDHEQWRLAPLLELAAQAIEALYPVAECGNCGGCRDTARKALAEIRSVVEGK